MVTKMETELFCLHCDKDTHHTVEYVGKNLKCIRCNSCGSAIELIKERLLEHYSVEFIERVLTKPYRMTKEIEGNLKKVLISLPVRVITKPTRLAREVKEIIKSEDKVRK
jgi:transcription elongation factor Elf1